MQQLTKILATIITALLSFASYADSPDSIRISVITCYPGPEIYELYGHEAIRVQKPDSDIIYNYGAFTFDDDGFVYRFVKGETDYMLAAYPFKYFLPEYIERGSKVVEQTLNLTREEASRLDKMLMYESLPQNRTYRYNYVKNNCATKIVDCIDKALGSPVSYPDSTTFASYRDAMRHYNRNYDWYQFGIDLALGSGIDKPIDSRDEMFIPVEMLNKLSLAHRPDGKPLVADTRILYEGTGIPAILPPTPIWQTPLALGIVVLIVSTVVCIFDYKHRRISRWWYALWFLVCGLAGILSSFLIFFSQHEAVSPNLVGWWLNPLCLLVPVLIWSRKTSGILAAYLSLNTIVIGCLLIVWAFQPQHGNPAFFPMMLASGILSLNYAIIHYIRGYNDVRTSVRCAGNNRPKTKKRTRNK